MGKVVCLCQIMSVNMVMHSSKPANRKCHITFKKTVEQSDLTENLTLSFTILLQIQTSCGH